MTTLRIPPPPRRPARARIARGLFERSVSGLERLEVIAPDGRPLRRQPGAPRMEIRSDAFFHRLAASGKIGFGEAYVAAEWAADDLVGVLSAFAERLSHLVPRPLQRLRRIYEPLQPRIERNTPAGARANISHHYDLSNDLFAAFLDDTMTYSCAVFEPGDSLADAQRRKYDAMCDLAGIGQGDHVLEIGTGWGGMAMHAAATRGCRVTSITISREQKQLAEARVRAAGLERQVEILLCDYRQLDGRFDRIVSIEMFEAVGEEYWAEYFSVCDRLLAPGGRMAMQTITMPDDRYRASRRSYTWVHKYIFPGGLIPSEQAIATALERGSRLRVSSSTEIGHHYPATLRAWRERFLACFEEVRGLGFDDTFRRTWEFYLAYCEAGFQHGAIGDVQLRLERP
jgi:cyclopropane-fatty-acyl-phospholipid synthase